jgi:Domain of unknown function (DUF6916)
MVEHQQDDQRLPSRRLLLVGAATAAAAASALGPQALAQVASGGSLSAATFRPFIDTIFVATDDDDRRGILTLVKIETHQRDRRAPRLPTPFSLIFRAIPGTPALPSETYEVQHTRLGRLAMFISPITDDPSYYEAPFN